MAGQEKREHKRQRICPITGIGRLSKSERARCAKEIIAASGADTIEHFHRAVTQGSAITFREQSVKWLEHVRKRRRKPVATATLESWTGCLDKWINPAIGDLPLSQIGNGVLKSVVTQMAEGGLSPKTINTYCQPVKMVVASAVDANGDRIYPRTWNAEFVDMPLIRKDKQNTPSFSAGTMTGLASWKKQRERMIFTLCGATGLRIGELLGLEIDKHISPDFRTLTIVQKARHGKIEQRLKTPDGQRQVDLHSQIADLLRKFVGTRTSGLLFRTRLGTPVGQSHVIRRHLHPALKRLGYVNPVTGDHKAGYHAFRRFRNTHLRNHTDCPAGLIKFWMGHAEQDMSDRYDKIREDLAFRKDVAERAGFGFELPVVPSVPSVAETTDSAIAA